MNNVFILIFLISKVIAATADCWNWECEFNNSYHYKSAIICCLQTLIFEDVETQYSYFKTLKSGQICDVFEADKKKED